MTSLAVCPDDPWHGLAVLRTPSNATVFFNVDRWGQSQVVEYLGESLRPVWIASAVFAGVGLASLLVFLIWRTFRCIRHGGGCCGCASCCGPRSDPKRQAGLGAVPFVSCTPVKALKVAVLLVALATMGLNAWAMTQVKKDLVQQGFAAVDIATGYTSQLSTKLTTLSQRLSGSLAIIGQVDRTVAAVRAVTSVSPAVESALSTLSQQTRQAGAILQRSAQQAQQASRDIDTQVTQKIRREQANLSDPANTANTVYYYVAMVVLGLGIGMAIYQAIVALLSHGRCLCAGTLILHVFAVLYFVGTIVAALAVGAANDVCPSVEDVVLHQLQDTRWAAFGDYYLNTANKATLADTLKKSDIVDLETVNAQIALVSSVVTNPGVVSASTTIPVLRLFISNVTSAIQGVTAAKDDLLAYGDARVVRPLYLEIKSFGCCVVPNNMANLFKALTSSGWMVLALCWVSCILLSRLEAQATQVTHTDDSWTNTPQPEPASAHSTPPKPPQPFDMETGAVVATVRPMAGGATQPEGAYKWAETSEPRPGSYTALQAALASAAAPAGYYPPVPGSAPYAAHARATSTASHAHGGPSQPGYTPQYEHQAQYQQQQQQLLLQGRMFSSHATGYPARVGVQQGTVPVCSDRTVLLDPSAPQYSDRTQYTAPSAPQYSDKTQYTAPSAPPM